MEQTTTYEAAAYTAQGTARERVTLPAELFDGTVNVPVMHQVVKAYLANQRQANAHTKNRRVVTGGNQKPWKQKGTGRARQGSTRAPHWVGGGTVFGPTNERNYEQKVPRKVRQLGRSCARAGAPCGAPSARSCARWSGRRPCRRPPNGGRASSPGARARCPSASTASGWRP